MEYKDCGVGEDFFPLEGQCYRKGDVLSLCSYEALCPHCRISSSLPDNTSLKTSTIFECGRLGYGRRIRE